MKKVMITLLLAVCILVGSIAPETVHALDMSWDEATNGWYASDENSFIYFVPATATEKKGAKIYGYLGDKTSVTLPKKCNAYKITSVSGDFSMMTPFVSLLAIKIPSGYTKIEAKAFSGMTSLCRVQIPATVKKISATAFEGCDLSRLTIVAPYGSYAEEYAKAHGIYYTNSTSLQIDTHGTTMYAGESKQISVLNNSRTVTWKSTDPAVVTVESDGTVTAKKAGTATVTAEIGSKTYSYSFKVLARTQKNVLKVIWTNYVTVGMSDYEKAVAAKNWLDGHVTIAGTSTSAKRAFEKGKVSDKGYANAYKKILDHFGLTTEVIAGTDRADNSVVIAGKTYTVSTLSSASGVDKTYTTTTCEGVAINKSTMTLSVGKTDTFKALGVTKAITWSSSNKKIATVDKTGKVTAKAAGTCTVTMKMDGKSYKCTVRVNS